MRHGCARARRAALLAFPPVSERVCVCSLMDVCVSERSSERSRATNFCPCLPVFLPLHLHMHSQDWTTGLDHKERCPPKVIQSHKPHTAARARSSKSRCRFILSASASAATFAGSGLATNLAPRTIRICAACPCCRASFSCIRAFA